MRSFRKIHSRSLGDTNEVVDIKPPPIADFCYDAAGRPITRAAANREEARWIAAIRTLDSHDTAIRSGKSLN